MVLESERSQSLARTLNIIYVNQGKVRGKAIDAITTMPLGERLQVSDDEIVLFSRMPNPSAGHEVRHEILQRVLKREELTPDIVKGALSSWNKPLPKDLGSLIRDAIENYPGMADPIE